MKLLIDFFTNISVKFLQQHPELGLFGSILGIINSPFVIIQYLSVIIGLIVAVLTLVVKIIELRNKLNNAYEENNISFLGYLLYRFFKKIDNVLENCIRFFNRKKK